MFSLKNISWKDAKKTLLEDLSCDIAPGECVAIELTEREAVRTLIRLLTGEERLQSGSILVDGIPLAKLTPRLLQMYRRSIGVVLPAQELISEATVGENVALPLRARKMRKAERTKRAQFLLTKLNLQEKAQAALRDLSSSEQGCVALAVALAAEPQILLIQSERDDRTDETSITLMNALIGEAVENGTSVIIATYSTERFAALRPRVVSKKTPSPEPKGTREESWKTTEKTRIIPVAL